MALYVESLRTIVFLEMEHAVNRQNGMIPDDVFKPYARGIQL